MKVEEEDKALRLILSLLPSYEHMKPIRMYGKKTLKYEDVTGRLLSEEKILESSIHALSKGSVIICRNEEKNSQRILVCWKCGQSRHVKSN